MENSLINIVVPATKAVVYILRGSWVAACPREDCANVEFADPRQNPKTKCTLEMFYCTYCKMVAPMLWPSNASELMEPLERRPVPRTRNWYPENHPDALRFNIEHGQSVADLWQENKDHGVS